MTNKELERRIRLLEKERDLLKEICDLKQKLREYEDTVKYVPYSPKPYPYITWGPTTGDPLPREPIITSESVTFVDDGKIMTSWIGAH